MIQVLDIVKYYFKPNIFNIIGNLICLYFLDYGPQHEKTEALSELVSSKRSPWNLDYSWSREAGDLRRIAVRSPWLVDENFILSHFKTLRIVNKEVSSNLV